MNKLECALGFHPYRIVICEFKPYYYGIIEFCDTCEGLGPYCLFFTSEERAQEVYKGLIHPHMKQRLKDICTREWCRAVNLPLMKWQENIPVNWRRGDVLQHPTSVYEDICFE